MLAPTRPDQAGLVSIDFLREVYGALRTTHDYVIVDTPPGFSPEVIASIDSATDICLVGMLDALSLKNTKLGLETLDLMGFDSSRIRFILNRADTRVGITREDVLSVIGKVPDVSVPSDRVSLQSRMSLRSAKYQLWSILVNVSRYRSEAIMILRLPSSV